MVADACIFAMTQVTDRSGGATFAAAAAALVNRYGNDAEVVAETRRLSPFCAGKKKADPCTSGGRPFHFMKQLFFRMMADRGSS